MEPVDWSGFDSLIEAPAPAVLVTYRPDETAYVSPVWFRFHLGKFEVVIAEGDVKLRHLRRRRECSLLVFETTAPFRGLRIDGAPDLGPDEGATVRSSIATRYLGIEQGRAFVEQRKTPGVVVSLDGNDARTWDLSAILPDE